MIDPLAADLFGRHVIDGAHHHVAARQLGRHQAGQAEVENFDRAAVRDEDVRGLDVAMHDAVDVGVVEPLTDLGGDLDLAAQAQSLRRSHPRRADPARPDTPSRDTVDPRARRDREW